MSTVTKSDLVKAVSRKTDQTIATTVKAVEAFLDEVADCLVKGERIELRGFGVLEPKLGKPRVGRNPFKPRDGDVIIPARRVIRFKAGKLLRDALTK